jgi:hypothetical protein
MNKDGLILHGCGAILIMSCPIPMNRNIEHTINHVLLSQFTKVTTTSYEKNRLSEKNF